MISIVVPCYNEEESLPYFYEEMSKVMKKMDYVKFELILNFVHMIQKNLLFRL